MSKKAEQARKAARQKKQKIRNNILCVIAALVIVAVAVLLILNLAKKNSAAGASEPFDLETYASEIDSKTVSDFKETSEVTEYVKLSIREYGELVIRLVPDEAPISVANFQDLVSQGFYNGTPFHRVYPGFMIQGGDPTGTGNGDSGKNIKGEFSANGVENKLMHIRGLVSMARGSKSMDSASCQFFIVQKDSTFLDGQYAGFGYVVAGLETVDNVCNVQLQDNGYGEVSSPVTPVILDSAVFVTPN